MKINKYKRKIIKGSKKLGEFALDVLYPKKCVECGREGKYICSDCEIFVTESSLICPVCGKNSSTGEKHNSCGTKYSPDGLVSIWKHDGVIKKAIKEIKHKQVTHIADELVERAFRVMISQPERFSSFLRFLNDEPKVTYVPVYGNEFNQAEIIAKEFGEKIDVRVESMLNKEKETESQTQLGKQERLKNLKGSFSTNNKADKVVLVNDVFTPGAATKECTSVLKRAGVEQVWIFTLARTT